MTKLSVMLQQLLDAGPGAIIISREKLEAIRDQSKILELIVAGLACQVRDQDAQKAALAGDPGID